MNRIQVVLRDQIEFPLWRPLECSGNHCLQLVLARSQPA